MKRSLLWLLLPACLPSIWAANRLMPALPPFNWPRVTEDDGYAVMERVSEFITTWESADIKKLEFMLHNSFVSAAGENKSKYLARLRKEAANSAGRKITMLWQGSKAVPPKPPPRF